MPIVFVYLCVSGGYAFMAYEWWYGLTAILVDRLVSVSCAIFAGVFLWLAWLEAREGVQYWRIERWSSPEGREKLKRGIEP